MTRLATVWRRDSFFVGRMRETSLRGLCLAGAVAFAFVGLALAFTFPPLTGRIVDQANIIPQAIAERVTGSLASLEAKSGIQLVVATVKSLEGTDIDSYANALFNAWGLGEKQKNNGVLVLVAPGERKVRIEVGYGLEGTLNNALSESIINVMAPRFKAGDYGGGIERGIDAIITAQQEAQAQAQKAEAEAQKAEADAMEKKKQAALADCGPTPKISGGPWFSSTYSIAAVDTARNYKNAFLCVKTVQYISAAPNPFGGKAARAEFIGYSAQDYGPVSYVADFPY